jgi:lysophospholipid acyltransferase (LPLAT)-like uncharacterized protein
MAERIGLDRVSATIWVFGSLLAKTWRYRFSGHTGRNPFVVVKGVPGDRSRTSPSQPSSAGDQPSPSGTLFCFWHTGILPVFYLGHGCGVTALVSGSRDGERLSAVLQRWGYELVRGSSSRNGLSALRECIRRVSAGRNVVVTPDGPTGPALHLKPGVAQTALLSGSPVVAVACRAARAWRLSSWDRFTIPRPFSVVDIRASEPIDPKEFQAAPDGLSRLVVRIEAGLNALGDGSS